MVLKIFIASAALVFWAGIARPISAEQTFTIAQEHAQGQETPTRPAQSGMSSEGQGAEQQQEGPRLVVVLNALDKTTARVTRIEAVQDQPVRFGTLEITMRTCHSNPPEETPETAAFLEIRDILNNQAPKPVFTGWMFASSPSVSAMEHPVYDIWVVKCKTLDGDTSGSSK